jgi:hypothetical protein
LLWSIDSRQRVIADEREINEALKWVKFYKISRSPGAVIFESSNTIGKGTITKEDIELGVRLYRKSICQKP